MICAEVTVPVVINMWAEGSSSSSCLIRGSTFNFDASVIYVGSLAYLAVVATVFGFWLYLGLLGRIGAGRSAYAMVLFPIIALGLSTVFEDYRWTTAGFFGVALVLLGNTLVLARIAPSGKAAAALPGKAGTP